jgi:excisionase family DNA binding protein
MSVPTLPGVFTIPGAAKHLKMHERTLRREIKKGKLQVRRIGGCVRILDTELARWLEDYEANA